MGLVREHDPTRNASARFRMRIEGTLTRWNDDRGFGFITPAHGGSEIFVHISAFPQDGRRPAIGEQLTFEIETDVSGKKNAKNLIFPHRPASRPRSQTPRREKPILTSRIVTIIILMTLASYGYTEYSRRASPRPVVAAKSDDQPSATYRCDGRTHCSQMTSCAEATFFLQTCPDVRMDGDRDGVPCEQQWCTGPLSK